MSPISLGSPPVIDKENPWPGLSAFNEAAQDFFGGRDTESSELLRLVGQAPLTVLFGKSGLGKTSLLQAGLFPRLRSQNFLPVYVRLNVAERSTALIEQLASALRDEVRVRKVDTAAHLTGESLWEHLHGNTVQWWSAKNQPLTPLFVLDQFEEVFTLGADHADAVDRLRLDLADLIENRIPPPLAQRIDAGAATEHLDLRGQRYKLLISFREDFLPDVEGWKAEIPSVLRNRLRLLPMRADRALQVVTGDTGNGRTHDLVSDDTGREIVRFVAAVQTQDQPGGRGPRATSASAWDSLEIEPALLSLVCEGLNEKRKARRQTAIDAALLNETGAAIIGDFYARCIADVPDRTRRFIEDELITEGGYRNSYPLQDALAQGVLTESLLRRLVDRRLLRVEHQLGVDRVELIHDRLTTVVREHRDRTRQQVRTRRQRWAWTAAAAAFLAVVGVGAWLFVLWRGAQRAERQTGEALKDAIAGRLILQSRDIVEGRRQDPLDLALLLSAASFRLRPLNDDVFGALQQAANETDQVRKVIFFPDPVIAFSGDGRIAITARQDDYDTYKSMVGDLHPVVRFWDTSPLRPRGEPLPGLPSIPSVALSSDGTSVVTARRNNILAPIDGGGLRMWNSAAARAVGPEIRLDRPEGVNSTPSVATPHLAFSPDGHTIAVSAVDHTVRLVDAITGNERHPPLLGHADSVNTLTFSPDSRTLASGGGDKVLLWDVASSRLRASLPRHSGVMCVAFSPKGDVIASGDSFGVIRLWSDSGVLNREVPAFHERAVVRLAFSPDGRTLASAAEDGTLALWVAANGARWPVDLKGHSGRVNAIAFLDNSTLITGGADGTLRWWVTTAQAGHGRSAHEHRDAVNSVAFSPDGKMFLSSGNEGQVHVWQIPSGTTVAHVRQLTASASSVATFFRDVNTIHSFGRDRRLGSWDIRSSESIPAKTIIVPIADLTRLDLTALSPDGAIAAVGTADGALHALEFATGRPRCPSQAADHQHMTSLAFTPQGTSVVSTTFEFLRVWDISSCEHRSFRLSQEYLAFLLAASPNERTFATAGLSGPESSSHRSLDLWRLRGDSAHSTSLGQYQISSLGFSQDGRILVSGGADGTLRFWSAEGHAQGTAVQATNENITAVALSPDGKIVVWGTQNGTVGVADAPDAWIDNVCARVGRNLSHAEWDTYVGQIPYVIQCPGLPVPQD